MYHLQGVVFIAAICAVNAAVVVNIYDDEVETIRKKVHEVEGCKDAACDQTCRFLGFDSGTCVGDTCECSKRKDHDQLKQNDIPSLDEVVGGDAVGGCDPNACDRLCRSLQFPGGVCVNGRCKCDNFRREPEAKTKNEVIEQGQVLCTDAGCNALCRLLGFPYGSCIGNSCHCGSVLQMNGLDISLDRDIMKEVMDNSVQSNDVDNVAAEAVRECDQLACVMGCRELGFPGGACFLGKCRCDKKDQKDESLRSLQAKCNNVNCYFMCRRWGYIGGSCHGDSCLCV